LSTSGHQVLRAANVSEAEALVRGWSCPDLVLLDWIAAGPARGEFRGASLRADQRTKDIPIIMLTAPRAGAGYDRGPRERAQTTT